MKMIPFAFVGFIAICLVLMADAQAKFARRDVDVPVADIVSQLEKSAKDHPDDAHAQYLLGRIHSLAWATDGDQIQLIPGKEGALPEFAPYASVRVSRDNEKLLSDAAKKHLGLSIAAYRKAVEMEPKNGLYHLGLAWMLEQKLATAVAQAATKESDRSAPAADRKAELKAVIDEYVKAFDLRLAEDKSSNNRLSAGDAFVSAEAAEDAIRLLKTVNPVDEKLIKRLEDGRDAVFSKGMAVTPIVVAMKAESTLGDLIDLDANVSFDFAGFGPGHHWPWINRNAGLLVWDPAGTGQITSGRQLFGTMTWQMLFRNGYEAMSMLDRNHDGKLSGEELKSIALWCDANSNGVSDAGEVVPLDKVGITAIDVKATNDSAGVLHITNGIHWADGHTTASFDWVPESK